MQRPGSSVKSQGWDGALALRAPDEENITHFIKSPGKHTGLNLAIGEIKQLSISRTEK